MEDQAATPADAQAPLPGAGPKGSRRKRRSNRLLIVAIALVTVAALGVLALTGQQLMTADSRPLQSAKQRNVVVAEAKIAANPKNLGAYVEAVDANINAGNYDRALYLVDRALEVKKDEPGLKLAKAKVLVLKGDYQAARALADQVLEKNPEGSAQFGEASTIAAAVDEKMGDITGAIKHLQRGVQHDQSDALLHVVLAETFARAGKKDDAVASYAEALKYVPDLKEALAGLEAMNYGHADYQLALAAYASGRKDEALRLMKKAAQDSPTLPWIQVALGDYYALVGDAANAAAAYNAALALDPKNKDAAAGLAALK